MYRIDPTAFPRLAMLVLVTPVLALGGCRELTGLRAADSLPCGAPAGAGRVHIDIRMGQDGEPSAFPDTCEVSAGTTVVWRGKAGSDMPFELLFKQASPVAGEPRGVFRSKEEGGRQVVERRMDAPKGTYAYGIRANGREVDPAIIIR